MSGLYPDRRVHTLVLVTTTLITGGIGSYLASIADGFKSRGWLIHCVVTNSKGDQFETFNEKYICHSLADQPLSLRKVLASAKLVNSISPDVILLNHSSLFHYVLPCLEKKIKPVVVLHSDDKKFYTTAAMFNARIFRWVAPSVGVTKGFAHHLPGSLYSRVKTISHGIDSALFSQVSGFNRMPATEIAFIGFIAENKGADLLPDILSKIVAKHPGTHLNIVGYGPLLQSLQHEFGQRSLLKHVSFTGVLSQNQVAVLLQKTDIFLLPTRIEGFGLSIAEAMMSGAVPVVSKLEGITDTIVSNDITGVVVDIDDVNAFSSAVIDLFSNPERLAAMKIAARRTAQENFSLQRMIDDYMRLFEEEDDRFILPRRGIAGCLIEIIRELMRKNTSGTCLFKQRFDTFMRIIFNAIASDKYNPSSKNKADSQ